MQVCVHLADSSLSLRFCPGSPKLDTNTRDEVDLGMVCVWERNKAEVDFLHPVLFYRCFNVLYM